MGEDSTSQNCIKIAFFSDGQQRGILLLCSYGLTEYNIMLILVDVVTPLELTRRIKQGMLYGTATRHIIPYVTIVQHRIPYYIYESNIAL